MFSIRYGEQTVGQHVAEFIVSILLGGFGLGVVLIYFVLRSAKTRSADWLGRYDTEAGKRKRQNRRDLGMAIVAIVSLAVFVGINLMEPKRAPMAYAYYWLLVL